MVSLKQTLDRLDALEETHKLSMCALSAALESLEKYTVPSLPELMARHKASLEELRRKVDSEPSTATLKAVPQDLDRRLREYYQNAKSVQQRKESDIREILALLSRAAETFHGRQEEDVGRLQSFAQQLDELSSVSDLTEIRRRLVRHVAELRECAQAISAARETSVHDLRRQLQEFRDRLRQVEELATTDTLTGVANRRLGEGQIERRIGERKNFCVLLFDLDHFKAINDSAGHWAGDEVLQMFARRVAQQIREGDILCRWGGDEFVAILNCGLREAMVRARQLMQHACGAYRLELPGAGHREIAISACCGVAEHQPGETGAQLLARADAHLYREKTARKPV
jgi:diguanylate cyclase (GGDEF)-like protein